MKGVRRGVVGPSWDEKGFEGGFENAGVGPLGFQRPPNVRNSAGAKTPPKPKRKQRMQIVVGILGPPPFETQFETTQRPVETLLLPPSLPKDLPRRNGGSAGGEGRERGKGKGRMGASREGGFERASHTTR